MEWRSLRRTCGVSRAMIDDLRMVVDMVSSDMTVIDQRRTKRERECVCVCVWGREKELFAVGVDGEEEFVPDGGEIFI